MVVALGIDLATRHLCPKLNGITCNGAFLKVYNDSLTLAATIDQLKADPRLIADMERIAKWQSEVLRAKNPKWMRKWQYQAAKILQPILTELDSPGSRQSEKLYGICLESWR